MIQVRVEPCKMNVRGNEMNVRGGEMKLAIFVINAKIVDQLDEVVV